MNRPGFRSDAFDNSQNPWTLPKESHSHSSSSRGGSLETKRRAGLFKPEQSFPDKSSKWTRFLDAVSTFMDKARRSLRQVFCRCAPATYLARGPIASKLVSPKNPTVDFLKRYS